MRLCRRPHDKTNHVERGEQEMEIKLFYSDAVCSDETQPTVFLNGLTETEQLNKAIKAFANTVPDIILYIPANGITKSDGTVEIQPETNCINDALAKQHIIWKRKALAIADCILFWIPSKNQLDTAAFIEFGEWITRKPNQIILGHSKNAENTQYIDFLYEAHCDNGIVINSLKEAVKRAAKKAADFRTIKECTSIYKDALSDVAKCRQLYKQLYKQM